MFQKILNGKTKIKLNNVYNPVYKSSFTQGFIMNSVERTTTKQNLCFLLIVFFGCLVSVYDNTLSVIYMDSLPYHEQNPVGNWLIQYGGVSFFVLVKAITTLLACLFGIRIVYSKYRKVLLAILAFQLCLFGYLTFFDPNPKFWYLESVPFLDVIEFYDDKLF